MLSSILRWKGRVAVLLLPLTLLACRGYQAPVAEQGERQVLSAPIIVDSSTPQSAFNAPRDSVATVSDLSTSNNRPAIVPSSTVSNPNSQSHRVRAGETLFSIAFQYDLDFRSLAIANELNPPYTIFVGQNINLDVNRVASPQSVAASTLGTLVSNNTVARAQGGNSRAGGLIRRAVGAVGREPQWQWPHEGRVLRGFQSELNKGVDIGGQLGDPVLAASAGDVVYSGRGVQGSGNLIIIRHGDRYLSAYGHNSAMLVGEGSRVRAGEKIAEVGTSPNGIAMLHFEIRVDGNSVDPAGLLPRR
ncbi:MAG: peptidoglycan DD-metalloendopeptidase family protein [Gammaproteobacteria bacterium]|nr:peptidoglycan DD-metalloendopeptidase family protein [Gammaproteobacteria bacterium]MDP6536668.1 peptidoglycan DD-metalloendopeptidase family protein [Gammaproteobacteria bacterium]MDP6731950.1 peptidoglycan DD-metalloendopeptidase family protein [Gammaproteobacteria bacterium]